MSRATSRGSAGRRTDGEPREPRERTDGPAAASRADASAAHVELARGWCAAAPLALAYELARCARPAAPRSAAEALISAPLDLVAGLAAESGGSELARAGDWARWALLAALTAWSARALARAGGGWLPHVGRQVLEGALAALVLGPLLVLVQREAPAWFPPPPVSDALPAAVPRLALVSGSAGTALWEELVFRLGAFGFLLFAARATALYFGAPQRAAALLGTLAATGISALAFAAFHVSPLVAWLGRAGEPFDAARFAWRLLAGAALALVYRWRGLGVAVWAHALFNALLLLGAGPGAFA